MARTGDARSSPGRFAPTRRGAIALSRGANEEVPIVSLLVPAPGPAADAVDVAHAHDWRLVEVQWDEYGAAIREWACACGSVRYN
jgi:hypothetical protein